MPEDTGLPFASTQANCMHACGHDVHTSVLLGTAEVLGEKSAAALDLLFTVAQRLNALTSADVPAELRTIEHDTRSLSAAEVSQKVYLAVNAGVLTVEEARQMIKEAGAVLGDTPPTPRQAAMPPDDAASDKTDTTEGTE